MVFKTALKELSTFGEPDALKGASPVRRGGVGNVLFFGTVTRWLSTLLG
jgi:hypothetical protein